MAYIKPAMIGNHRKDMGAVRERVLRAKKKSIGPGGYKAARGALKGPMPRGASFGGGLGLGHLRSAMIRSAMQTPRGGFDMGGDIMPMPGPVEQQQPDDSWADQGVNGPPIHPNLPPRQPFRTNPIAVPDMGSGGMGGSVNPQIMELVRSMLQGYGTQPRWEGQMRPGGVMGAPPSGSYF